MSALSDIQRLVECESPSEDLAACNEVITLAVEIANKLLKNKAEKITENGRPVFWWGAKNPKILLLCHLDTVWPTGSFTPTWQINGDKATGPGVFDMKTGFIQALYALVGIENSESKVALVATTDEETGSATSKDLIIKLSKGADAVLVFEASSVVATKATLLSAFSIPTNAYKAWMKPVFISKTPGPVALSPFICQVGVNDPVGQTVSR